MKQRGVISGPLMAALIVLPFAFCSLMQPKPEVPDAPDIEPTIQGAPATGQDGRDNG